MPRSSSVSSTHLKLKGEPEAQTDYAGDNLRRKVIALAAGGLDHASPSVHQLENPANAAAATAQAS
jgi:hypothetical protein